VYDLITHWSPCNQVPREPQSIVSCLHLLVHPSIQFGLLIPTSRSGRSSSPYCPTQLPLAYLPNDRAPATLAYTCPRFLQNSEKSVRNSVASELTRSSLGIQRISNPQLLNHPLPALCVSCGCFTSRCVFLVFHK
jgi:hypothetical protein